MMMRINKGWSALIFIAGLLATARRKLSMVKEIQIVLESWKMVKIPLVRKGTVYRKTPVWTAPKKRYKRFRTTFGMVYSSCRRILTILIATLMRKSTFKKLSLLVDNGSVVLNVMDT